MQQDLFYHLAWEKNVRENLKLHKIQLAAWNSALISPITKYAFNHRQPLTLLNFVLQVGTPVGVGGSQVELCAVAKEAALVCVKLDLHLNRLSI
jgi:hypothetical protein